MADDSTVRVGASSPFPGGGVEARDANELGDAIRRLRKDRGWTQVELAELASISRPSLIRLERGEPVQLATLLSALAFLGAKLRVERR